MAYKIYSKLEYAAKMGVNPSRISQLLKDNKMKVCNKLGSERIVDCQANADLFKKPSFLRGKKRGYTAGRQVIKK